MIPFCKKFIAFKTQSLIFYSSQSGNSPRRPLGHIDRARADLNTSRRRCTLEQEIVDVRIEVRLLRTRKRAVRVVADEGEAHVVGHSVGLVDEPARLHRARGRDRSEPVNVVFNDKEAAGHDECGEQVVVFGNGGCCADVGVEAWGEPGILADDLAGCLDVGACGVLRV